MLIVAAVSAVTIDKAIAGAKSILEILVVYKYFTPVSTFLVLGFCTLRLNLNRFLHFICLSYVLVESRYLKGRLFGIISSSTGHIV